MKGTVTCVSGIDTDIGKTVVTGLLAKAISQRGQSVITQKVVQTGCQGMAEDIVRHREIMGVELLPEDIAGLSCPYVFQKPCSPHLAAELEKSTIDLTRISDATKQLAAQYQHVLVEGAGGLLVPLTRTATFLDYLERAAYPLILVTSPRLGSINHTLLALEVASKRGVHVSGLVYNCYESDDVFIEDDSRAVFADALTAYGYPAVIVELGKVNSSVTADPLMPGLEELIPL